jgi:hypothetical protein
MCACVPPPPRRIARRSPKMRVKTLAGAWTFKENMFYAVGASMMGVSMVIAAWGEGVNVCLCPPPPHRIAHRSPKMRVKNAGWGPRTRSHSPHESPRLISKKGQKYFGGPFSFSLHTCATILAHWLYNWLIVKNGVILFFFMKRYVLRICNAQ